MKSRKTVLFLCATNIAAILFIVAPHLRTQGMTDHSGQGSWLPSWKNPYKEPFESFVSKNRNDTVCQSDQPCVSPPDGTPKYISRAVAQWTRFPQDIWEDATSKPWQALQFIGVKPGDKVVDMISGDRVTTMYWSRLFYHIVGDEGRVFPFIPSIGCRAAHVSGCIPLREYSSSSNGYGIRPVYTLLGDPRWNGVDEALDMERTTSYRNLYTILDVAGQFAIPEQADVVWSTGLWHQLHSEVFKLDMSDFLPRVFESINNGGSLIIADYAGNPGTGFTQVDTLHRVDKEAIKAEVAKYGFVFDSESSLWTRKDDDHTQVVPEQATPGTADMFILKFKKPMNAPPPHRLTREELGGWLDANDSGNPTPEHGQKGGGGNWYNADYTEADFGGATGGIMGSWYVSAGGSICTRQEYQPITAGIIGCHYEHETLEKYHKLGETFVDHTDFCGEHCQKRMISPVHSFVPRPEGCTLPSLTNPTTECRAYYEADDLRIGHILN